MTESGKPAKRRRRDLAGNGLLRSLEATLWRLLGKRVRADNVLSGARGTFVERWQQERARKEMILAYELDSAGVAAASREQQIAAPLYAVEPQVFPDREVIFTCLVGDLHSLEEPPSDSRYEHVVYVERDIGSRGWSQRAPLFWDAAPRLVTIFHKYALASLVPDGTKMLWVDSDVVVSARVAAEIFDALDHSELCLFKHPERDCVYDDISAEVAARRSMLAACQELERHLSELRFPRHGGLFDTRVIGFRVCPQVRALFRDVFGLCYRYAPRDRLVLPVALAASSARSSLYNRGTSHLGNSPGVTVRVREGVVA